MATEAQELTERLTRIETHMIALLEKADHIQRMSEALARIQEKTDGHRVSIDLLFDKVRDADNKAAVADAEVRKWVNRGVGGYFVMTLMGVVVLYFASSFMRSVETNQELLVTVDRRLSWVEYKLNNVGGEPPERKVK